MLETSAIAFIACAAFAALALATWLLESGWLSGLLQEKGNLLGQAAVFGALRGAPMWLKSCVIDAGWAIQRAGERLDGWNVVGQFGLETCPLLPASMRVTEVVEDIGDWWKEKDEDE